MTLGEIIKKYRTDKNISLRKFAEISGLSHSYVDSLEKNFEHSTKKSITPSTETIEKVANALNVDIIDIFSMLYDDQEIIINQDKTKTGLINDLIKELDEESLDKIYDYVKLIYSSANNKR